MSVYSLPLEEVTARDMTIIGICHPISPIQGPAYLRILDREPSPSDQCITTPTLYSRVLSTKTWHHATHTKRMALA